MPASEAPPLPPPSSVVVMHSRGLRDSGHSGRSLSGRSETTRPPQTVVLRRCRLDRTADPSGLCPPDCRWRCCAGAPPPTCEGNTVRWQIARKPLSRPRDPRAEETLARPADQKRIRAEVGETRRRGAAFGVGIGVSKLPWRGGLWTHRIAWAERAHPRRHQS
jgi:hypothetical protein